MASFNGMCMHEIKKTYVRHQSISHVIKRNEYHESIQTLFRSELIELSP